MSKYEWERGTIVIPAGAWSAFRRGLVEKWNEDQLRLYALATSLRAEVEKAAKGKRGFDRAAWLRQRMDAGEWGSSGESARSDDHEEVVRLIGLRGQHVDGTWTAPTKTSAPKRKDLRLMAVSRGGTMHLDDATIHLDDATHSVTWAVSENNHACETARSLPMARALFAALYQIEWKRGSGGKIVGNDEYSRDGEGEGEGGNYVTAEYGPDVAKRRAAARSSFGGGYRR
jgi:hypothetical protein